MKKWMMLLVVSMLLIMAPMSVAAAGKTITGLGTGTIGKPVVPTSENDYWSGSHVYFGSKSTPILFNVLKVGETNFGGNTMLLDCASILQTMRFDDDSNQWVNSEIKTWLNGTFLSARFTDREQQAIAGSTKNSYVVALTGEKVFLLDADEVMSDSYGFFQRNGPDNYTRKKYVTSNGLWWLRSSKLSQGNNTQADYVSTNGGLSNSSFNYTEIGM